MENIPCLYYTFHSFFVADRYKSLADLDKPWYVQNDPRLAAPLINTPFNHGEIGVLMRKGQGDLLDLINAVIDSNCSINLVKKCA